MLCVCARTRAHAHARMLSSVQLSVTHGMQPARLFCPWHFPGKNTGAVCHFLLQGIFPMQGFNPALMHFGQVLSHLSHQGSSLCSVCFSSLLLSETPFGAAGNNPSQLCSVFSWGPRHEMDQIPFLVNVPSRLVLRNDPAAQGWCFFFKKPRYLEPTSQVNFTISPFNRIVIY